MNIIISIMCIIMAYIGGLYAGKHTVKASCTGMIKMARDEEDKGFYVALEVSGKDALKEMYESDTVTFNVKRMPETQIKQGL